MCVEYNGIMVWMLFCQRSLFLYIKVTFGFYCDFLSHSSARAVLLENRTVEIVCYTSAARQYFFFLHGKHIYCGYVRSECVYIFWGKNVVRQMSIRGKAAHNAAEYQHRTRASIR